MRAELGLEGSLQEDVERSQFAWYMFEQIRGSEDGEDSTIANVDPSPIDNTPSKATGARPSVRVLPVEVQSKGLSYIRQNVPLILGALRAAEHGATREDVIRQIMVDAPFLNRNSAQSAFATIPRLGLLELRENACYPTKQGMALLDGEPPGDVITRVLIAKVFGVAHILNELRNVKASVAQAELAERLQSYYPNWTTSYAPTSLFQWLLALKLVESRPGLGGRKDLVLTDAGEEWAATVPHDMSAWRVERAGLDAAGLDTADVDNVDVAETPFSGKAPLKAADLSQVQAQFAKFGLVGLDETLQLVHGALHALPAKRFVLLAGLSGTGKSALARGYAQAYCDALGLPVEEHRLEVAVRPDWIDPGGLLGFFNPIGNPPGFQATKALRFLLNAAASSDKPYFLCLDEMNLARVEHYFAPLLSAMEGARLEIHAEGETIDNVPASIEWPRNLFIIGTLNMDESTQSFSDKVLDRAFVFEFWDVNLERWREARLKSESSSALERVFAVMKPLYDALYDARRHFGYRVLDEVMAFCRVGRDVIGVWSR